LEAASVIRGYQTVEAGAAGNTTSARAQFLARLDRWRMANVAIVVGSSLVLMLVIRRVFRHQQQAWEQRLGATADEWGALVTSLRSELSEKASAEAHLLGRYQKLEEQAANLSRTNAAIFEELNRRKRIETTQSWEQRELARSKDVLELHVQARTQEFQKLQRRHELILNSAGEGICGLNLDGTIAFANPAAAKITGWAIDELVGQSENRIVRLPVTPGGRGTPANPRSPAGEPTFVRRDGTCFQAEFARTSITEDGRIVGTVLIFKDVTERKQAELALSNKAAELARSNAELEQFAFVASHDLQEPLRKILAFGDRLKAKCARVNLEEGQDYLERMQNAAARMQRLIHDLLTFSRVISRPQQFVPVDLGTVTREVLGDLEMRIEKGKAQVEVDGLPTIEADPTQMRQLLQNLIGNALKFQPAGGTPKIRIEASVFRKPSVTGQTTIIQRRSKEKEDSIGEEFCELRVKDNGIGFEEKYLDRIFAVFQRLHGRQEYEGTGVGLAVCRRIVDRHGGTITARSKLGDGATFLVTLPVRQPMKPEKPS
jgi:two-component system sensor kinase FixL